MFWRSFALIISGVLQLEKTSARNVWSCIPSKPESFVWIATHGYPVNITSPTTFALNMSVNCSWKINTPQGYRIRIHFNKFNLENSANCSTSSVELVEKRGMLSVGLGRYCGSTIPSDVLTKMSFVTLIYQASNGSNQQHPGFHATVSLAPADTCSLLNSPEANNNIPLTGTSGVFITPVFPLQYPENIQCRWIITVPSGNRIRLTFHVFHLGSSPDNDGCDKYDYVEVRDSDDDTDPPYGTFCGSVVPSPIISVGPSMVIRFRSDEKQVFQGFFARYDAIPGGFCTQNNSIVQLNLTHNATGRLSSPNYPFQFPSVSACYWRLKAPDGYRIKIHFTTIKMSGNCGGEENSGEWVRVDDSFVSDFSKVASFWGKYCSNESPPVIYSTRSELQVFLTSNYSDSLHSKGMKEWKSSRKNHGFYATYEVIQQGYTSRCRTDLIQTEPIIVQENMGTLVSPGYPHSYPVIVCTWKIIVPHRHVAEVNFHDFEIDCAGGSKLKVGGVNEFCGANKPGSVMTSKSDLKLTMVIRKSRNTRGFRATFAVKEQDPAVASVVPWVIIPIVLSAVGITVCVVWRRQASGRDRGSSFRASIITRMRTQSTTSH